MKNIVTGHKFETLGRDGLPTIGKPFSTKITICIDHVETQSLYIPLNTSTEELYKRVSTWAKRVLLGTVNERKKVKKK